MTDRPGERVQLNSSPRGSAQPCRAGYPQEGPAAVTRPTVVCSAGRLPQVELAEPGAAVDVVHGGPLAVGPLDVTGALCQRWPRARPQVEPWNQCPRSSLRGSTPARASRGRARRQQVVGAKFVFARRACLFTRLLSGSAMLQIPLGTLKKLSNIK